MYLRSRERSSISAIEAGYICRVEVGDPIPIDISRPYNETLSKASGLTLPK